MSTGFSWVFALFCVIWELLIIVPIQFASLYASLVQQRQRQHKAGGGPGPGPSSLFEPDPEIDYASMQQHDGPVVDYSEEPGFLRCVVVRGTLTCRGQRPRALLPWVRWSHSTGSV